MVDTRLDGHAPDLTPSPSEPNEQGRQSRDDETLASVVTVFVRRRSDTALALFTAVGIAGAAAVALLLPSWWRLLPLLAMSAALGAWGIADRERAATGRRGSLFAGLRLAALAVGVAAALTTALIVLRVALGTWIS